MASCFFLVKSNVPRYLITKIFIFSRILDFVFLMSPGDKYYQFYKNAPTVGLDDNVNDNDIDNDNDNDNNNGYENDNDNDNGYDNNGDAN